MKHFEARTRIAAPRAALYAWHARPGAFERLTPPGDPVRLVADSGGIGDGARKVIALGLPGLTWVAVHDQHVENRRFRDVQERGPFRSWAHVHEFEDDGPDAAVLVDRIEYELPFGRLGDLVAGRAVRLVLERLFAHRQRVTRHDVELFAREPPPAVPIDVRGDAPAARGLRAFLSAGGWSLSDGASSRVEVARCGVLLDGRPMAPFPSADDATLSAVHRALRARLSASIAYPPPS